MRGNRAVRLALAVVLVATLMGLAPSRADAATLVNRATGRTIVGFERILGTSVANGQAQANAIFVGGVWRFYDNGRFTFTPGPNASVVYSKLRGTVERSGQYKVMTATYSVQIDYNGRLDVYLQGVLFKQDGKRYIYVVYQADSFTVAIIGGDGDDRPTYTLRKSRTYEFIQLVRYTSV